MIAQNSHGPGEPRRTFSPAIAETLANAMREFDAELPATEATLRSALADAAYDARKQGFGPEQLVLALKAIEADVSETDGRTSDARERFHSLLLRGMLTAYFGPGGTGPK
jgi:hypothetical protein